jgi:uncharacterized membrane-anchored protein
MRETRHPRLRAALPLAVKVPEITLIFWVLKLLTTGMGEAMSDFMGQHSVPIAGAVGIFGLGFALWLQFRTPDYRAPVYWFAVMMVAVFGTMAADGIHDGASIPYSVTTPVFPAFVAATFLVWYRSEGTLSIHSINTAAGRPSTGPRYSARSRWARRPATSPRTRSISASGPPPCCSP